MSYIEDIDKPNLTETELFEYLAYEEGLVGVTRRSVKAAVNRREIVPTRIGNRNLFSKRQGIEWIDYCRKRLAPDTKAAERQAV